MLPIDRYPRIVFGRTKIALTVMIAAQLNRPVGRVRIDRAITGTNTVVTSFSENAMDLDQFDYCEVVAVSPVMASAPPVEAVDDDDPDDGEAEFEESSEDEDTAESDSDEYDYWGPLTVDRPSAEIERDLAVVGLSEVPIFGRRLLLVSYKQDLLEFDLDKAKQRVRKRLGSPLTVWQGRSFEGYCFVDNTAPDRIVSRLDTTLHCDEVEDYLLVQPVAVVRKDSSGLSPLADWVGGGWKNRPISVPDRKSGRYERPA
jgi:hypothetical protein